MSKDLNAREIGVLVPLAVLCLVLGVYPTPLLKVLEKPTADVAAIVQDARRNPPAGWPGENPLPPCCVSLVDEDGGTKDHAQRPEGTRP